MVFTTETIWKCSSFRWNKALANEAIVVFSCLKSKKSVRLSYIPHIEFHHIKKQPYKGVDSASYSTVYRLSDTGPLTTLCKQDSHTICVEFSLLLQQNIPINIFGFTSTLDFPGLPLELLLGQQIKLNVLLVGRVHFFFYFLLVEDVHILGCWLFLSPVCWASTQPL